MKRFHDARDWFFEKRFGLFVHWGLYAIKGWHEQEIWRWPVSREDYGRYLAQFHPHRFDPDAWLDAARAAGMEYVVFTTKHCDGFCNWDSKYTDFKITNTPYGRDVLRLLSEACRKQGMPLCLYYSIPDMHHPGYPHAGRPYEFAQPQPGDSPGLEAYLDYVRAQMRELLTQYGPIHGWWWDANVMKHRDESFHDLIRELQPAAVINPRGFGAGDFRTPERDWDNAINADEAFAGPTEACQSVGLYSWGWKEDEDHYSDFHLRHSIAKVLAKGGNYLLNVGPRADGTFAPDDAARLRRIGKWLKPVREAFDGTVPASGLSDNRHVLLTRRGETVYVILHKPPTTDAVRLRPIGVLPDEAVLLNDGSPVECVVNRLPGYGPLVDAEPVLRLRGLPVNAMAGQVLAVRLRFSPAAAATLPTGHQGTDGEREFAADAYA